MIQEIEQIKAAERDATLRIKAANREADNLLLKAREDAAVLFEKRREEGELEVKKIRDNSLAISLIWSSEISEKADREVEEILRKGEIKIPDVINLIIKRVIGGSGVLSGKNG